METKAAKKETRDADAENKRKKQKAKTSGDLHRGTENDGDADDEAYVTSGSGSSKEYPDFFNRELSESALTYDSNIEPPTKLKYPPYLQPSRIKELIEVDHVYYRRGVFGCIKRKWDTIGDVSADEQSDMEEGRWDFWKAYYCAHTDPSNSAVNEIFLAWSILYTTGQNSHQDLISLMLKHGGLAFLLVSLIVYIGLGYPMYVLETMMGQYGSRKPFTMLRLMAPYMQGIGPALWLRTLLVGVESLVTSIYGTIYFFDLYICNINHNQFLFRFWSKQNSSVFDLRKLTLGFTGEPRGLISQKGTREWIGFLLLLTTFFAFTGLRSFGKLYSLGLKGMFIGWLGYLIIVVLRTMNGDWNTSIMYYPLHKALKTDWWKMIKGNVWMDAIFFVINSLGLVTLVHPYFASRCFFHYRTARDGIFIILLTIAWNLIGATAVLLYIGYITVNKKEMQRALEQIGGFQGVFITYVMKVNQANLVGNLEYDIEFYFGLYYGMIAVAGLFAFHSCLRALIQCSYQEYTSIVLAMSVIIILLLFFCVVVPFVFISPDGVRILVHLDYYLHHMGNVIFVGGCFFWSVAYSHNFAKVVYDIRNMVHLTIFRPLGENHKICAYYPKFYRNVIVLLILALLAHSVARLPYPVSAGTDYSGNSVYLGMASVALPVLIVVYVWILACMKAKHSGQSLYRPHRDWYKNWYHNVVCFAFGRLLRKSQTEVAVAPPETI